MKTVSFKKKLEEDKKRLEDEMNKLGRRNPASPGEWEAVAEAPESEADLVDQAEVIVDRENNAAILADLEARYAHISTALERIKAGTYGRCEVCDKPIEPARLAADPSATTCIEHK